MYVARLPRSATVVFEVAPEVDVRRSVLARPAGGGGRLTVERQYHEILRIWVRAGWLDGLREMGSREQRTAAVDSAPS